VRRWCSGHPIAPQLQYHRLTPYLLGFVNLDLLNASAASNKDHTLVLLAFSIVKSLKLREESETEHFALNRFSNESKSAFYLTYEVLVN
jgi:hypothetical protein